MDKGYLFLGLWLAAVPMAAQTQVEGSFELGAGTHPSSQTQYIDYTYASSKHRYTSQLQENPHTVDTHCGLNLTMQMKEVHQLQLFLNGNYNYSQGHNTRTESLYNEQGVLLSRLKSSYNQTSKGWTNVLGGARYQYRLPRKGASLSLNYQYKLDYGQNELDQQVLEQSSFTRFSTNLLQGQERIATHNAELSYVCPLAKGHALVMSATYEHQQMDTHQQQAFDQKAILDSAYCHLTQYIAPALAYRLTIGQVSAMARLEYRYSRMQQRNLHDIVPFARIQWQIDSIHSLSTQYGMRIIRPLLMHVAPMHILGAYTEDFGNPDNEGAHVHRVALSHQIKLKKLSWNTELAYLTTKDGFNAIWKEVNDIMIATWGNVGIRNAVSLTPSANWQINAATRLHAEATLLWDQRIAEAIHMSNDHLGIAASISAERDLPYALALSARCDYAYGNTVDLYSHAGHGLLAGLGIKAGLLPQKNLVLRLNYDYRLQPDIYVTQGMYTGCRSTRPGNDHRIVVSLAYKFY